MRFTGQHVLVLGLGKSGVGAMHLLLSLGAKVTGCDSRKLSDLPDVQKLVDNSEISFTPDREALLSSVDALVVSPGISPTHSITQAAVRRGIPVVGEIELASEYLRGPILAITGSNGKTTTTSLVGHILETAKVPSQVGGNIGFAATDMIPTSNFLQWNVLELSSFQLETVSQFHAQIAAVLNITPNHLDRHGYFETYAKAKGNIFRNQRSGDWAVLNASNEASSAFAPSVYSRVARFCGEAANVNGKRVELFGKPLMSVDEIPLPGNHNLENVMAAATMASLAGAPHADIAAAVSTFKGVRHRLEFIREFQGVKFYNDSKATSVDATLKAVEALPGPLWVILGGLDKGGSYMPLAEPLRQKAKAALLIGSAAPIIEKELKDHVALDLAGNLENAIHSIVNQAQPGDTVLLAPACASYDQFKSFEHRGDTFRKLVEAL
jgi:UDP-N-acetylmuramoylalanine--D-glutamate ligase